MAVRGGKGKKMVGGEGFPKLRKGGVLGKDRGCMIKAYILKSLTSPLVWLMRPTSHSDRGKRLEKWCNYCFLNRGLKRPVWKKDLVEILQGILDSRLSAFHPSTPPPPHTLKPPDYWNPSPSRRFSSDSIACLAGLPLSRGSILLYKLWLICIPNIFQCLLTVCLILWWCSTSFS